MRLSRGRGRSSKLSKTYSELGRVLRQEVGNRFGFRLGEWSAAGVDFLAGELAGAGSAPLVGPISIQIRAHAEGSVTASPVLAPQPFRLVRVLVAVRIH